MLNQKLITLLHGAKLILIQKNISQTLIAAKIDYGSKYDGLRYNGTDSLPLGNAHFLEHMLMYKEEGHIGNDFLNFGSYSNALTSLDHTIVYSTMNHCENEQHIIRNIIRTVMQEPNLSCKNIERERTIILSEIQKDTGNFFYNLNNDFLKILYKSNPIVNPILGTTNTIKRINFKSLHKAYSIGYLAENITFYILGTTLYKEDYYSNIMNKFIDKYYNLTLTTNCFFEAPFEPSEIIYSKSYSTVLNDTNYVVIGFKDPMLYKLNSCKRDIYIKLLSHLFPHLLSHLFSLEDMIYSTSKATNNYGFIITVWEDKDHYTYDEIINKINPIHNVQNLNNVINDNIKNMQMKLNMLFDSVDLLLLSIIEKNSKDSSIKDYINELNSFILDDFMQYIDITFNGKQIAIMFPRH